MVKRKQGLKAGTHKIQHGGRIDLKAPSYKWLVCRRCPNEVKVSIETFACVCSICMTRACDHMPRIIEPKKKSLKVVNTFEKNRAKEENEATLAATFKKKKAELKDEPEKKPRKKKVVKKKTRKKRVSKRKSKK